MKIFLFLLLFQFFHFFPFSQSIRKLNEHDFWDIDGFQFFLFWWWKKNFFLFRYFLLFWSKRWGDVDECEGT
jgi:hypothetical protein